MIEVDCPGVLWRGLAPSPQNRETLENRKPKLQRKERGIELHGSVFLEDVTCHAGRGVDRSGAFASVVMAIY